MVYKLRKWQFAVLKTQLHFTCHMDNTVLFNLRGLNTMYLLTEWEGRTGKYLARTDRAPNIFPSGPTLLSQ